MNNNSQEAMPEDLRKGPLSQVPAFWAETANLGLASDGRLSHLVRDADGDYLGRRDLGSIGRDPRVGDELAGELAELLDAWRDSPGLSELEREWREDYERGLL